MRRESVPTAGEQPHGRDLDLLSRIPAIVCELAPDGTTLFVNEAVVKITGYRPEDLLGKNWWDIFYPGDLRRQVDELYAQFEGGDVADCEMVLAARDGTRRTLVWYSSNRRLPDGTLHEIIGFGVDITEHRIVAEALRETNQVLQALIRASPLPIFAFDPGGNVTMWNPAAERVFGWNASEVLGRPLPFVPEDRQGESRTLRERVLRGESFSGLELIRRKRDGSEICLNVSIAPALDAEGNVTGIMSVVEDITERKRAEDLFRIVSNRSPIGVHIVQEGKFSFVNPYFEEMTGYSKDELIGRESLELVHPDDRERVRRDAIDMLKGYRSAPYEYRVVNIEGELRWILETVTSIEYEGKRAALGNCRDVTERKRMEMELAHLADHDPLTGLANRRVLEEALARAVDSARRGVPSALMYIDADHFKEINDRLGHAAGDNALVKLAGLLQSNVRGMDLVARLGGDEFAVLLEHTDVEQAHAIAQRLCEAAREFEFDVNGSGFHLTLSIGLEVIDSRSSPAEALSCADSAMYSAKEKGRNQVVQYIPKTDCTALQTDADDFTTGFQEAINQERCR